MGSKGMCGIRLISMACCTDRAAKAMEGLCWERGAGQLPRKACPFERWTRVHVLGEEEGREKATGSMQDICVGKFQLQFQLDQ